MTSSFRYPPQLLHRYTEPQWLPPSEDQKTSSLDRLEGEEQAQLLSLKKLVLPENIPDPIGVDDLKRLSLNSQPAAAATGGDADGASLLFFGAGPSAEVPSQFWQKYSRKAKVDDDAGPKHRREQAKHQTDDTLLYLPYGQRLRHLHKDEQPLGVSSKKDSTKTAITWEANTVFSAALANRNAARPTSIVSAGVARTPGSAAPRLPSGKLRVPFVGAATSLPSPCVGNNNSSASMMSFSQDDTTFDDDDDDDEDMDDI